jgi:hypothetical protein
MAKRRRKKGLGFSPDRWSVFTVGGTGRRKKCSRRTFTSYTDAAVSAKRCSKNSKKPCLLLASTTQYVTVKRGDKEVPKLVPTVVGVCKDGYCRKPKPDDHKLIDQCYTEKNERRDRIKSWADRARMIAPSKAAKTRTGKLSGRRR